MTYQLSSQEQADVQTLLNQGKRPAAYKYIYDHLGTAVENQQVPAAVRNWFGIAADVNANSGSYSNRVSSSRGTSDHTFCRAE